MDVRERTKKTRVEKSKMGDSVVVDKKPKRLGCDADLPLLEKVVYFVVYSTCFIIAMHKIYNFPLENAQELYKEDFEDGWKFTGRKRDISDFEWHFWSRQFKNLLVTSLFHALGSRVISVVFPQYRMVYFTIFQIVFLWYNFGLKPMLVFLGHNVIYYLASRLKSVFLSWVVGILVLISFVSFKGLSKWQFYKFTKNVNDGDFLLFTSLMCQLRGMSFCLDACQKPTEKGKTSELENEVSYGFMDLLGYNFYFPLFCNGPVVLYNEFYRQVKKPAKELSKDVLLEFTWDVLKTLWWFMVMEFGFHYFYITSLARDPYIIENVSVWMSTGLMYTIVLLFSIKYVIFYRFAGMFARLDGIHPPGIPKCVLSLYLFTDMWKYFDQGLYNWLMKYIYIPLGGSKNGILKQLLSSITTFAYVFYWHGAYDYLCYWSIIQWLGVISEAMARRIRKTAPIYHLENEILSPAATRRIHAIFGSFTVTAAILSNAVFLVNYQAVVAYLNVIFIKGGVSTILSFAAIAYCLIQVIMEVHLQRKEYSKSKKQL